MKAETISFLIELNRRFYAEFGPSFAATRRRIQEGVRRALTWMPDEGIWLDLGCGSGALAAEWLRQGRQSAYLGLDFSETLLAEARQAVGTAPERVSFARADLADPQWAAGLPVGGLRGAMAFAVLHHLPSSELRARVLRQVRELLAPNGLFFHSEWQFQHSPKLMARRLPWETVGLDPADLEPGDTLLDWRAPGGRGLRYVHLFDLEELNALAAQTGFTVRATYESDGQGGRLGLYQVWEMIS